MFKDFHQRSQHLYLERVKAAYSADYGNKGIESSQLRGLEKTQEAHSKVKKILKFPLTSIFFL